MRGAASDDECHSFSYAPPEAQSERGEECGGPIGAAEVPGLQLQQQQGTKRRIAPKVLVRCKQKVRELTRRTRGISLEQMLKELAAYLRGWKSYFSYCQTPWILRNLDYWIRRRLRSMIWKQWKRGAVRFRELRRRDVSVSLAAKTAGSVHGPWRLANSPALAIALPNAYFDSLGLPSLLDRPA